MRVVIADDHGIVREGLRWMLADLPDIEVVGEAESGEELLQLLDDTPADVVLLDVRMPGLSGLEALETLQHRHMGVRAVILSMYDKPSYVRRAIELGASGYLLKSASREEVVRALRLAAEGKSYVQGDLVAAVVAAGAAGAATPGMEGTLSRREREVLQLVAAGAGNKQIAVTLKVSEATVKVHLKHICTRLGARSRAEAVAAGVRLGIIE